MRQLAALRDLAHGVARATALRLQRAQLRGGDVLALVLRRVDGLGDGGFLAWGPLGLLRRRWDEWFK
ncbi:MAG: hypothetical protein WEB04_11190 [Dehalococcoidia bacterium]